MPKTDKQVWLGPYRLVSQIAVGGMAEVFLAIRPGLEGFEKSVAIKRIRRHLCEEPNFVEMFLNEARLAAQLQHPNIVQIYDLGYLKDAYFIAMEYIPGRDMSRVVPKAESVGISFPLEYALSVAASVLDGLSYAHGKTDAFGEALGIVHRDITPENIMVGWNGNVKILDFGIAKAESRSSEPTRAGEIKGKLSYVSPEQGMGKKIDPRSDVFTLGVVLYEWLTGYKLFTGESEVAILNSIIEGRVYPPSYFREDVPSEVEAILMRALEKDPDRRYSSARDMQSEILQYLSTIGFSPTSGHLANFMKQLFKDEIADERARLQEIARDPPRRSPPPPPKDAPPDRLTLSFPPAQLANLEAVAQRSKTSVEEVVMDLLKGPMRYIAG